MNGTGSQVGITNTNGRIVLGSRPIVAGMILSLLAPSLMEGCAFYHPLPLDDRPRLPAEASTITIDASKLPFPFLARHKFDPSDGLDMTEVATLAVVNNPDLRLARDEAGVARAQAFAAGLLPDPQLTLTGDYPKPAPGVTSAYNLGLGYDLDALVTHAAGASSARADRRKVDLDLLWQEWQTVARARLLFTRALAEERLEKWLAKTRDLLDERNRQVQEAMAAGEVVAADATGALTAWQDAARQVDDMERRHLRTVHELDALLGLAPDAKLRLVDDEKLDTLDERAVRQALENLPDRRPDLLALKAGYAAQDSRYRQAILAQFPPINLAFTVARDMSGVPTRGFALAMGLPLLNGNRGNVRIEVATRRRMHDEYENRIAQAHAEVDQLLADGRLDSTQLQATEAALPALDSAADNARLALDAGNVDGDSFARLESTRIARHVDAVELRQSLTENRIALLGLLGGEFTARPETSR